MYIRWAIAVVGVAALAALTVRTQMPWLAKREVAMVKTSVAGNAQSGAAGEGGEGAATPILSCPADAKPANLNFTMKDVAGKSVTLADFKGKVLLLDFWATWCGPCKVEIPHFIEFQEKYAGKGFQVVGISVDDTAEKLVPYVRDMKMNYPVLQGLDHDDVQDAYGPILGIPVSVLISRDGKICATHTGLTGKDVFEQEIKALL
jgi:thiol-disulfide isomerase/thioredoxin